MEVNVEYKDERGNISSLIEPISILGLIKHLAIAGQGYIPSIKKYTRTVGLFAHFIEYLNISSLSQSRFSEPPHERRDPTEKGQFSNIVGKGLADFLSKRLSNAKVTHNYEAAMYLAGHDIKGERPDLYCIGNNMQFAVEAKGYSRHSISEKEMNHHKDQSKTGPLPVHFSIASVSHGLYNDLNCKYYDPPNEIIEFNEELNRKLNEDYYEGIFEYLKSDYFTIEEGEIEGRPCFFIGIFGKDSPYSHMCDKNSIYLILQRNFKDIFLNKQIEFNEKPLEGENYYLDTDGIGIRLLGEAVRTYRANTGDRNLIFLDE